MTNMLSDVVQTVETPDSDPDIVAYTRLHPSLRRIHRLWCNKRNFRLLPEPSDFEPRELDEWSGHVLKVTVERADGGCRFHACGFGAGRNGAAHQPPAGTETPLPAEALWKSYDTVVCTAEPLMLDAAPDTASGSQRRYQRLLLPLGTGKTVDTILECGYCLDTAEGCRRDRSDAAAPMLARPRRPLASRKHFSTAE